MLCRYERAGTRRRQVRLPCLAAFFVIGTSPGSDQPARLVA